MKAVSKTGYGVVLCDSCHNILAVTSKKVEPNKDWEFDGFSFVEVGEPSNDSDYCLSCAPKSFLISC